MVYQLKSFLTKKPRLKHFLIGCISSHKRPRPRWWVRCFVTPLIHPKGKGTHFAKRARMDIFPWRKFYTGKNVWIDDYAIVNNGAGDVILNDRVWVGIGCTLIGPIEIEENVTLGQHVFISGFNHGHQNPEGNTLDEPLDIRPTHIGKNVFLGTNVVVIPGVSVGNGSQIGAGSVVVSNIPPYSIAVGNPAQVIRSFDKEVGKWIRTP